MLNILFISYDLKESINFYRGSGIVANLEKMCDHNFTIIQWSDIPTMSWHEFMHFKYDVIFMSRPYSKDVLNFLSFAKVFGKKIYIDFDDNLLDMACENKLYTYYIREDVQNTIKSIVKLADAVSVTNEFLKQVYLPYNEKIFVIPNALNNDLFKRGTLKPRKKTVFWRGSDSHIYNLMAYGGEMAKAMEEFQEWQFCFMGFYPWFLPARRTFLEGTDIILYHQTIVNEAPAVFHAPINNDPFNRCRSAISTIEAAYCGAASIAPTFWTAEGGWKIPGTIPYHDNESYYEALRACCSGEVDCVKQSNITYEFIQDVWTLSRVNKLRVELLKTLE